MDESFLFHEELKKLALDCTKQSEDMPMLWEQFLKRLLTYWGAWVKMDLSEAVEIMLAAAGMRNPPVRFWFKEPRMPFMFHSEDSLLRNKSYNMTIAVFETINYWCWYNHNVGIVFNRQSLINTLEGGRIEINWNTYLSSSYQYIYKGKKMFH